MSTTEQSMTTKAPPAGWTSAGPYALSDGDTTITRDPKTNALSIEAVVDDDHGNRMYVDRVVDYDALTHLYSVNELTVADAGAAVSQSATAVGVPDGRPT